ncbi:MAG: oxidoreductase [Ferruginibacter sp.]|nr:oxidoreductase [Ferruginibacter sp.]
MKTAILFISCFLLATNFSNGQSVKLLTSGTKTSIRGLSVVDDKTVWVSGSNGTVGLSTDSGKTWKWINIKGFEKTDFRDIEAFDARTAIIMGIDSPAYILKTTDAGENWKTVFEDHTKGMFLDAMEFTDQKNGIVIGDPIAGKFFIATTTDDGNEWKPLPADQRPLADSGEACFASSGTNVRKLNNTETIFISGGLSAHFFRGTKKIKIPIIQGKETTGANSIAVKNPATMIVVGGDFTTKDSSFQNCIITKDGGTTWTTASVPPHGYRSCVEWLVADKWICCGLTGVDYSIDEGKTFSWISKESYHVCRKAKNGKAVYFAGGGGRVGKLILH